MGLFPCINSEYSEHSGSHSGHGGTTTSYHPSSDILRADPQTPHRDKFSDPCLHSVPSVRSRFRLKYRSSSVGHAKPNAQAKRCCQPDKKITWQPLRIPHVHVLIRYASASSFPSPPTMIIFHCKQNLNRNVMLTSRKDVVADPTHDERRPVKGVSRLWQNCGAVNHQAANGQRVIPQLRHTGTDPRTASAVTKEAAFNWEVWSPPRNGGQDAHTYTGLAGHRVVTSFYECNRGSIS